MARITIQAFDLKKSMWAVLSMKKDSIFGHLKLKNVDQLYIFVMLYRQENYKSEAIQVILIVIKLTQLHGMSILHE